MREDVDQAERRNQYHSAANYVETDPSPADDHLWPCSHRTYETRFFFHMAVSSSSVSSFSFSRSLSWATSAAICRQTACGFRASHTPLESKTGSQACSLSTWRHRAGQLRSLLSMLMSKHTITGRCVRYNTVKRVRQLGIDGPHFFLWLNL